MTNYEEKYKSLKERNSKIKQRALELELEAEKIPILEKNVLELTNKINNINYKHEREIMYKDAEIDRLKMSLEDYKERYKEIREDYKDLRKSIK